LEGDLGTLLGDFGDFLGDPTSLYSIGDDPSSLSFNKSIESTEFSLSALD